MATVQYRDLCKGLLRKIPGTRAVVFISLDGSVLDEVIASSSIDSHILASEYATLFRIATRTSEDAGTGEAVEHIVGSDRFTIVARRIASDSILLVVTESDQVGRARYELRRVALGI